MAINPLAIRAEIPVAAKAADHPKPAVRSPAKNSELA
jgi:hypothetical protein